MKLEKRGLFSSFQINLLLFVGSVCLLAFHIGTPSLFESSEARYGSIARNMVETGNYLIPIQNGLPHFSKPPLTYWFSALGMRLFGMAEAGAKAFLPIAGGVTIFAAYNIGLLLLDPKSALCGSYLLMTSAMFLSLFRGLTTDPLLAMFETLMVWALLSFVFVPRTLTRIGFWACCGFIMLTKGPPGFLPLLGLLPIIWFSKKAELKAIMIFPTGWFIFVTLGLGWYFAVTWKTPGLFSYFAYDETINRIASEAHQRTAPFYYFIGVLLLGLFPWTPFFVKALFDKIKTARQKKNYGQLLLLGWLLVPFIVLSLCKSKLATYLLPFLVPASLLTGNFLSENVKLGKEDSFGFQLSSVISMMFLAIIGVSMIYISFSGDIPSKIISEKVTFLGVHFLFLAVFCVIFWNYQLTKGIILALGLVLPGVFFILLPHLEGNEEVWKDRFLNGSRQLLRVTAETPPQAPIICVEEMLEGISFYSGRVIPTWEVKRETRFSAESERDLALFGPESLQALASRSLLLLIRDKDVQKIVSITGKQVQKIFKSGFWGLYQIGDVIPKLPTETE